MADLFISTTENHNASDFVDADGNRIDITGLSGRTVALIGDADVWNAGDAGFTMNGAVTNAA